MFHQFLLSAFYKKVLISSSCCDDFSYGDSVLRHAIAFFKSSETFIAIKTKLDNNKVSGHNKVVNREPKMDSSVREQ